MTPVEIGVLGVVALLVLLVIRVPVGISMIIVAAIGNSVLTSTGPALAKLGSDIVRTTQSYSLSVVPLFVLMGVFLTKANLGAVLYDMLNYFFGRRKGGMAVATIAASAAFGAVCGSVVAAVSTLTSAAVPEMRKYKYDEGFATGVTAVGSAMGMVIPPSTALVIYGFLTEESIGQLLMAGILPGIMTMLLLMLTVPVVLRFKPQLAPEAIKEKIRFPVETLKYVWAVPVIFLICLGGIYTGFFTPTEAGAVGAFISLLFAVVTGRMKLKGFVESLTGSVKVTAMVFFMIIGGSVFGMFLTRSLIPMTLTQFVAGLEIAPFWIVMFFLLVYTAMGPIMDEMATLVIMTPIVYPIVVSLGYNGVWFGVMTIMMLMSGLLTPPVGVLSLVAASVAKVPSGKVFAAQWPFWITLLISCVLIAVFPVVATLLPSMMFRR